jgi:hemoglobin-like flavoprotein
MAERTTGPTADQRLLTESLALVMPVADEVIAAFYDRLLTGYPHLRAALDPQREQLPRSILALATWYDDPQCLLPAFAAMGRRHQRYGLGTEDYAAVGAVLLGTLRDFAGPAWSPAYHGAWVRAYTFAAGSMMRAGAVADEDGEHALAA